MNSLMLGVAILVGAPGLKDPPKKDPGIVGEWSLESSSIGGKAAANAPITMSYQFTADGKWIIKRPDGTVPISPREFKLDPKADPSTIDVEISSKGGLVGRTMLGIWKVDGDTLTIYFSTGDERPKNFTPADGARTMVMVLKRAKKGEAEPPKK